MREGLGDLVGDVLDVDDLGDGDARCGGASLCLRLELQADLLEAAAFRCEPFLLLPLRCLEVLALALELLGGEARRLLCACCGEPLGFCLGLPLRVAGIVVGGAVGCGRCDVGGRCGVGGGAGLAQAATTSGSEQTTMALSLALVTNSRTTPPISMMPLRRAIDSEEPITVCSSVVSAVSRDWISEARLLS